MIKAEIKTEREDENDEKRMEVCIEKAGQSFKTEPEDEIELVPLEDENFHIKNENEETAQEFVCKILLNETACGEEFQTSAALKRHYRTHNKRIFVCDWKNNDGQNCNKKFRESSKLKEHIKIHTGEKTYNCGYCDRKFVQKQKRIQHERIRESILNTHNKIGTIPPQFRSMDTGHYVNNTDNNSWCYLLSYYH